MAGQDDGEPELDGGSKFLGCQRGMLTIKIEGGRGRKKGRKRAKCALIRRFATLLGEVVGIFAQ
jgi:hypothetical protein